MLFLRGIPHFLPLQFFNTICIKVSLPYLKFLWHCAGKDIEKLHDLTGYLLLVTAVPTIVILVQRLKWQNIFFLETGLYINKFAMMPNKYNYLCIHYSISHFIHFVSLCNGLVTVYIVCNSVITCLLLDITSCFFLAEKQRLAQYALFCQAQYSISRRAQYSISRLVKKSLFIFTTFHNAAPLLAPM